MQQDGGGWGGCTGQPQDGERQDVERPDGGERRAMSDPSAYVRTREKGARDIRYPDAPAPLAVPVYDNHAHLEIEDGDDPLSLTDQLDRAAEVLQVGRRVKLRQDSQRKPLVVAHRAHQRRPIDGSRLLEGRIRAESTVNAASAVAWRHDARAR